MLSIILNSYSYKNLDSIIFSLRKNKCVTQIIIIGPLIKNRQTNYKNIEILYIQSYKKPTICLNIALKKVNQEYVLFYTNDLYLNIDNGIDYLFKKQIESPDKLFSCVYTIEKKLVYDFQKIKINNNNINLPFAPIVKMKEIKDFNFIDEIFITSFWDIDLYLKLIFFHKKEVVYTFVSLDEDKNIAKSAGLFSYYGFVDKQLLFEKWSPYFTKGELKINSFKSFSGHWKSVNKFIFFILNLGFIKLAIAKLTYIRIRKSNSLHHRQ